jgi:hypothetical protein
LSIDENNAEALFNTAQVLSSFAEALFEEDEGKHENESIQMLREAIELLSACLAKQEFEFEEQQSIQGDAADGDVDMDDSPTPERHQKDWEWVRIQEPTTASTLIETATTQLAVITQYIGYFATDPSAREDTYGATLANLSAIAGRLINEKLPAYLTHLAQHPPPPDDADADADAAFLDLSGNMHMPAADSPLSGADPVWRATRDIDLARAGFACALADAERRGGLADVAAYVERVDDAFSFYDPLPPGGGSAVGPRDLPALTDHAQALRALAATVLRPLLDPNAPGAGAGDGRGGGAGARAAWEALGRADQLMDRAIVAAKASALAAPARAAVLVRAFAFRGDAALLRRRVAAASEGREREHGPLLLKNAGVYYRGAERSVPEAAANDGEVRELVWDVKARERAVRVLQGEKVEPQFAAGKEVVKQAVQEMVKETLVTPEELEMLVADVAAMNSG